MKHYLAEFRKWKLSNRSRQDKSKYQIDTCGKGWHDKIIIRNWGIQWLFLKCSHKFRLDFSGYMITVQRLFFLKMWRKSFIGNYLKCVNSFLQWVSRFHPYACVYSVSSQFVNSIRSTCLQKSRVVSAHIAQNINPGQQITTCIWFWNTWKGVFTAVVKQ